LSAKNHIDVEGIGIGSGRALLSRLRP
jgi:hypothetical protein